MADIDPLPHRHSWRDHCETRLCPWRRCTACGSVQDVSGHTPGRVISGPLPPEEPK